MIMKYWWPEWYTQNGKAWSWSSFCPDPKCQQGLKTQVQIQVPKNYPPKYNNKAMELIVSYEIFTVFLLDPGRPITLAFWKIMCNAYYSQPKPKLNYTLSIEMIMTTVRRTNLHTIHQ